MALWSTTYVAVTEYVPAVSELVVKTACAVVAVVDVNGTPEAIVVEPFEKVTVPIGVLEPVTVAVIVTVVPTAATVGLIVNVVVVAVESANAEPPGPSSANANPSRTTVNTTAARRPERRPEGLAAGREDLDKNGITLGPSRRGRSRRRGPGRRCSRSAADRARARTGSTRPRRGWRACSPASSTRGGPGTAPARPCPPPTRPARGRSRAGCAFPRRAGRA